MDTSSFLPLALLVVFASALIVFGVRSQFRSAKLTDESWKSLVGKLHLIDIASVIAVAQDYLNPSEGMFVLQPEQIWKAVGGCEGLNKMRENAEIMLALAEFVRETDFESSVIVAERMRRDAVLLRKSVRRLEIAQVRQVMFASLNASSVFDIQQAAASYYLMRERLFALYKVSLGGLYPTLSQAV